MKNAWLILLMILISIQGYSQAVGENCSNGVDDDGDGFIDCFDTDCASNSICTDFYVGNDKDCQAVPDDFPAFALKASSKSNNRTTYSLGRMNIGDMNRDGTPDIVTTHYADKKIYILNGNDLSIQRIINTNGYPYYLDHAIVNLDDDNCGEIVTVELYHEDDKWYWTLAMYNCQGTEIWRAKPTVFPVDLGFADFNGDGKVELYYRDEIMDAATGTILVENTHDDEEVDGGPVAVDILDDDACADCEGLELVVGGEIYAFGYNGTNSRLTRIKTMPATSEGITYAVKEYGGEQITSSTSIADFNQDGYLDVLTSGACNNNQGATAVFFWDVENEKSVAYVPSNNWPKGTGRLNIADIDGDGKLNATFVSGKKLFALREDFSEMWINSIITEGTSGLTSTTVFDFNNDGASETVYRDEAYLYIIDGKTGTPYTQVICKSRTGNEYPIVADVDGDGATEICVTCATDDGVDINNWDNADDGQVRVYKSNLEPWVPARRVWNQHGYFNVNVNDDLTIPLVQQKHHLVFSNEPCLLGSTGPNRPLNSFLNQAAFLDSDGCPTYASPDLQFVDNSLEVDAPTCPDQEFPVSFEFTNSGDLSLTGDLPITFYDGDPTQPGATKLNTEYITVSNFSVGSTKAVVDMIVQGTGSTFTLYAVLNDNGTTVPTPINLPNSEFYECNYDNNIQMAEVAPKPFALTAAVLSNNFTCPNNASFIPNGIVEAYRLTNGSKEVANYNFYWFDGATASEAANADYEGSVYSGLDAGTYSVYAQHKGIDCGSDTVQVTVITEEKTLDVGIVVDHNFTNCLNPDGVMHAEVYDALGNIEPYTNYTYKWFEGTDAAAGIDQLSTSYQLTNLEAITYTVMIVEKTTGCEAPFSETVPDETEKPGTEFTKVDAACTPANSGSAKYTGESDGYTANWYDGADVKPSPDFTGVEYIELEPGSYVLQVTNDATGCTSNAQLVEISSTNEPSVEVEVLSQLTACDTPNGSASATANGSTTDYTFTWYSGNNTTAVNQVGTTSATITGLEDGTYTVKAVHNVTGCSGTATITIDDETTLPSVAADKTDQTHCTPANGSATAEASNGSGAYTYYWFNGNIASPNPTAADFEGSDYNELEAGFYTVVAVDDGTTCVSAREVVEVLDNTPTWTVETSMVPQTSCDTSHPNGSASASVGGNTSDYSFAWFSGTTATGTPVSTDATMTGQTASVFTVQATETTPETGCTNTALVTITSNPTPPKITDATIIDNSNCADAGATGSITIEINNGEDPAAFTIEWFEGSTTSGTAVTTTSGVNHETAASLEGGSYTVRVTSATCSTTETFTVAETTQTITIESVDISVTGDNNCIDPGNGEATVTEVTVNGTGLGNTTGYSFVWYESDAVTPLTGAANGGTITNLSDGNYYVQAVQDGTSCQSVPTALNIADTSTPPALAETIVNNTNCTDNGAIDPIGSIAIDINTGADPAGFSIAWFEGSGTAGSTLGTTVGSVTGANGESVEALSKGFYTVEVTATASPNNRCVTTEVYEITDTPATISVSTKIDVTDNTNCVPLNGTATVTAVIVDGIDQPVTDYTFTWYANDGTTPLTGAGTDATMAQFMSGGNYFVKAANTTTLCTTPVTPFTIANTAQAPVISQLSLDNNTHCTGAAPNGTVSIDINSGDDPNNYTITWFEETGDPLGTTVGTAGGTNNNIASALPHGTYTVEVTANGTPNAGCEATAEFTIIDDLIYPTPAGTPTGNSACESASYNGSIIANVGGTTTGYEFSIYKNVAIPLNDPVDTYLAENLGGGTYTVKATDIDTQCAGTIDVIVSKDAIIPAITVTDATNVTNCSTPNGSALVTAVSIGTLSDYEFKWYDGKSIKTTVDYAETGSTLSNLSAGDYTVTGRNVELGCDIAVPETITVSQDPDTEITLIPLEAEQIQPSTCNNGQGQLAVKATTPTNAVFADGGFDFTWYSGDKNTSMDILDFPDGQDFDPNSNRISSSASGQTIKSGIYTVVAVDLNTGCKDSVSIDLIYSDHPPTVSAQTTPQKDCAIANGSLSITITPDLVTVSNHSLLDQSWYQVIVKTNNGNDEISINGTVGVDISEPIVIDNLPAGSYTVKALEINSNLNLCESNTSTVEILTDFEYPVVIVNEISPNQYCADNASGNGYIALKVDGIVPPNSGYDYEWNIGNTMTGISPTTPVDDSQGHTITNLTAGWYTVRVTSQDNHCATELPVNIGENPYDLVLTAMNVTHQTDCSANGKATVKEIQIDNIVTSLNEFTYTWLESDGSTVITNSGNTENVGTALAANTYAVSATHTASQCIVSKEFTVDNESDTPTISALFTPNTICSGGTLEPNAGITIQINGANVTNDYKIAWFTGDDTSTPVTDPPAVGTLSGAFNETYSGLPANTNFSVMVTGITTPNKDCASKVTLTTIEDLPVLAIEDLNLVNQIDCDGGGEATIAAISVDGNMVDATEFDQYTFTWLDDKGATQQGPGPETSITGLYAGDYQVIVKQTASNCDAASSFALNIDTSSPVLDNTIVTNRNCPGINPDGTILIEHIDGSNETDDLADYSITWYYGTGVSDPWPSTPAKDGIVKGDYGRQFDELAAGTYTLRVVDNVSPNKGCVTEEHITIGNNRPIVEVTDTDIVDKLNCSFGGSAAILEVKLVESGFPTIVYTDNEFTWYNEDNSVLKAQSADASIDDLDEGTYAVKVLNLGSNCSTQIGFTIDDLHKDPKITDADIVNNTHCEGGSPVGSIEVNVDGSTPAIGTEFDLFWYNTTDLTTPIADGTNKITDLDNATYMVQVVDTNPENEGCKAEATFTVVDDPDVVLIKTLALSPQVDCDPPDGAAEITEMLHNNVTESAASGYTFTWYETDGTTTRPENGTSITSLKFGTYYVEALNTTTNCATEQIAVTIADERLFPSVDLISNHPNVACNTNYTGELEASVREGTTPGITSGYDFDWFIGENITTTPIAASAAAPYILTDVQEGFYTVVVTDNTGDGLGCATTTYNEVVQDTIKLTGIVSAVAQTICDPANGVVAVDEVMELREGISTSYDMTIAADLAKFKFKWSDSEDATATATTASWTERPTGTYSVEVTSDEFGCSALTTTVVNDERDIPTVKLLSYLNPTMCVEDVVPGMLSVAPNGDILEIGNYTFMWYEGGEIDATKQTGETSETLSGIMYDNPELTYTVELINSITNCKASQDYTFTVDKMTIITVAITSPLTDCDTFNGTLSASVRGGDAPGAYDWEWYEGEGITGNLISTDQTPAITQLGTYTVQALHKDASLGCVTIPDTIAIEDARIFPHLVLTEITPLTYCDPNNPNGAAQATVDGVVIGYVFDWFEETPPTSSADNGFYTGSINTGLSAATYYVRATDIHTACENIANITINFDPASVAPPVTATTPRTNCATPNGSAYVVEPSPKKVYSWYDGSSVGTTPDHVDAAYYNIDAGPYTVTALDPVSLCVSDPVVATVLEEYLYPDFDLKFTLAECDYANGGVEVILLNNSDIQSVIWEVNGFTQQGTAIADIPAGYEYVVTATTSLECSTTRTFDLPAEIVVYNAVSSNGDGMNDYFNIGCIADYSQNTVRIYNRAGTLVYEAKHYDNEETVFTGTSNRGVSVLGTNLPDGTYFYVIDKGNGTTPKTGYLELLR